MLQKDETVLVLIDIQGKLAEIVDNSEFVIENIAKMTQGVQLLGLPILWLEQYPKGLGKTVEAIAQHLTDQQPIEKITYSAYDTPEFVEKLEATGRKKCFLQVLKHIFAYIKLQRICCKMAMK